VFGVLLDGRSADTMSMTVKRGAVLVIAGPIPGVSHACPAWQRAVPAGATAAELVRFSTRHVDPVSAMRADD